MPGANILVVAVDGLRASSLGAYGNTTYGTPALDRFSADSFLLDWCYAPTTDLTEIYHALWQGTAPRHPLVSSSLLTGGTKNTLPRIFASRGYETTLITDDADILLLPGATAFGERIEIARGASQRTDDVLATEMAHLFEAACDVIENRKAESTNESRLVWVHSRGMYGAWDAPLELQQLLLDEADPPPVESAEPPGFMIGDAGDPDAAFRYGCAYAAQAMVLDRCWEGLMDSVLPIVDEAKWLVMLLGVRGYPLGEHSCVGGVDARLYSEQLHVPWLIRFPDGCGRLTRSNQFVSHMDVLPTLMDVIDAAHGQSFPEIDGASVRPLTARGEWRDALIANGISSRAIRTEGWCLRQDLEPEEFAQAPSERHIRSELFVRPDDRWEANDVAKLCPEVVDELTGVLDEVQRRIAADEPMPRHVLPKADVTLHS
jgi:hypothetical protein